MEEKLASGLTDIGYKGRLLDTNELRQSVENGSKNVEYTKLVNFLANELRTLCGFDEDVNAITSPEDWVAFVMEIGSFLKELNCPYSALCHGHISDRLQTTDDKLLLLDYLMTELMAARILQERKPDKKIIELKLQETDEAASLHKLLMTLRFPKPPPNITVSTLFQKLTPTVQSTVQKAGPELAGNPLFSGLLSVQQWDTLNDVQSDLSDEYRIRREMLLTRLDVTIQSFQWSDRTKGKDDLFEKIYNSKRTQLKVEPDVDLAHLIAARDDLAIIEKTSNSSVRRNTKSSLNKVMIGQVPDRGGRASEQAPPPPEMPSWMPRAAGGGAGRGGGGRGGGGRGGNFRSGGGGGRGNFSSRGDYSNNSARQQQQQQQQSYSTDNARTNNYYDNNYSNRGNFDSAGSYGRGGGGTAFSNSQTYNDNQNKEHGKRGGGGTAPNRSFDSAGSYGGGGGGGGGGGSVGGYDQQNSKRAKTYDSFQSNRTTYADQYVQESESNQQYRGGRGGGNRFGGRRGGGSRSNYNRGGGRNNY